MNRLLVFLLPLFLPLAVLRCVSTYLRHLPCPLGDLGDPASTSPGSSGSASFTLNMFCPQFREELMVFGERGRLTATESFDFHRDDMARNEVCVELGEMGASRRTELGYTKPVDQSGHHGATWFEHVAFADQLDGKTVDAATPQEGLWSIVIASAAQVSSASGEAVNVDALVSEHGLENLLNQ